MVYIYTLERNDIPFYVGRTNNPSRRLTDHKQRFGTDITLSVIEETDNPEFWEEHYIWLYQSWGFILENKTYKSFGPQFVTDDVKQILSEKIKNHPTRGKKIGESISGKYIGREAPWAKGMPKGFKYTESQKQKMRKPRKNKWVRPPAVDQNIIDEIRELYSTKKYTKTELHKKFNLSQSTIRKIVDRLGNYK